MRKLRKTLGVALGIVMLMGMCVGCGEQTEQGNSFGVNASGAAVSGTSVKVEDTYAEQIKVIAGNRDKWEYPEEEEFPEQEYIFMVSDLDQDGSLELVTSFSLDETGLYTYYTIQEVKTDRSGLETLQEGRQEEKYNLDIPLFPTLIYCDESKGIYHYPSYLWTQNTGEKAGGYALDSYIADNKVNEELISYVKCWNNQEKEESEDDEFNTVNYYNGNGEEVSEKEYDNLEKKYYKGMKRGIVYPEQIYGKKDNRMTRTEVEALSEEEWIEKLTASWEGFHIEMEAGSMGELPVILSQNKVETAGKTYYVNIEMVKGEYWFDEYLNPSMGNSWMGDYKIRVYTEENNLDSTVYYEPITVCEIDSLLFNYNFSLVFDDYNNDGNMEFTLGQYCSSSGYEYSLFRITPEGKVENLDVEMFIGEYDYSIPLEKISPTSFQTKSWDNSKSKFEILTYQWKKNKFVIAEKKYVSREEMNAQ